MIEKTEEEEKKDVLAFEPYDIKILQFCITVKSHWRVAPEQ